MQTNRSIITWYLITVVLLVLWCVGSLPAQVIQSGGYVSAGGGTYPVSMTFNAVFSQTTVAVGSNNAFYFTTRTALGSTADGNFQIDNLAQTLGIEDSAGTAAPTLGTCTGGSLTSGSRNGVGEVTGTTGGSCIVQFATTNWTNTPFCIAEDETAAGIVNVTARSTAQMTISNITSGHAFQWICRGRI